jgi:ribosomal protein L37AE/L43A
MTRATEDRAPFVCPSCRSEEVYRLTGTDGTYECYQCGGKTHEKIEENRSDLEDLADRDSPASKLAWLLVEGYDA